MDGMTGSSITKVCTYLRKLNVSGFLNLTKMAKILHSSDQHSLNKDVK